MPTEDLTSRRAYSTAEVARMLGVHPTTVAKRLRSGQIRSFKLGPRRLIAADALEEFIRQGETAPWDGEAA